jgi:type II secretory pathway pseudopilin PulG
MRFILRQALYERNHAFSLIEMMVVLALTIILCSLSIPLFLIDKTEQTITQELEKIEVIMIFMRQQAMAQNQELTLRLEPSTNSYAITKDNHVMRYTLAPTIVFGFVPGTYGPPANPTTPIQQEITFPHQEKCSIVTFFPTGSISSGTLYLKDKNNAKCIIGALTCNVAQVSYIRKYVYKDHQWNRIIEGYNRQ